MQGHINKISTKQGTGRNGPWTMYNLEIDGTWYGCGFKKPDANEGDYVEFDVVQKGEYKNAENVKRSAGQPAASPSGPAPSIPVNKKDVSIHYQSCRKDAIQTLGVLLTHDAVKLPAKAADKYDAALALINELTNQFYFDLDSVIAEGGVKAEDLIPAPDSE